MMEAVTYHSITMLFYDLQSFTQILMRDFLLSDLDFFTIFNNNRRYIFTDAVSGCL